MTAHLVGSLARRGVEAAVQASQQAYSGKPDDTTRFQVPRWALVMLAVTFMLYFFCTASLEYVIRIVYAHLAMVETPETTVEVHTYQNADKEDAKIVQNLIECGLVEESTLHEPHIIEHCNPITSSLRRTKQHLTSIAGQKARWRGLPIFLFYAFGVSITTAVFKHFLRVVPNFTSVLAEVGAMMLWARIHCVWTHRVISMPPQEKKSLRSCLVTRAQWRHDLLLPTALPAAAHAFCFQAVRIVYHLCVHAVAPLDKQGLAPWAVVLLTVLPPLITGILLGLFVMLPAYVTLVRVEASLLSPEVETIVPMDRTFGDRIPYIGAKLHISDAWNSFTWEARRRLVKLYAKFFLVICAVTFAFAHIFALELLFIGWDGAKDLLQGVSEHVRF